MREFLKRVWLVLRALVNINKNASAIDPGERLRELDEKHAAELYEFDVEMRRYCPGLEYARWASWYQKNSGLMSSGSSSGMLWSRLIEEAEQHVKEKATHSHV